MKKSKIIRDKRYTNTIWCLCSNYEDYLQFAKDLWLYTDIERTSIYTSYDENNKRIRNNNRWFTDAYTWSSLFGVDTVKGTDSVWEWEMPVDPIKSEYEIKEKPDNNEYPVIVHYSLGEKDVLWVSLFNLLKGE